jgi:hypothetical protein
MKYYFITYQATNKQGSVSTWNQVTDQSPMKFIKENEAAEDPQDPTYRDFVVINTCEISKSEFNEFHGHF